MINRLTKFTPSTWFDYAHHEPLGTPFGRTSPSHKVIRERISLETSSPELSNNLAIKQFNHLISWFTSPAYAATKPASSIEYLESSSASSTVNSYVYTYDNVGNRLTLTDSFGTHTYGYDNLYRLTNATLPTEAYTYDQVGNRNPTSFVYDAANRLLDDGVYTYTYDDNGNLITKTNKPNPSDITSYSYNVENQLVTVNSTQYTVSYIYDGLGRRIEKNVDGAITRYIYDNEDIIAEYDGSSTLQAKYLHGPGVDEPLRMERGGQNYFYHADGLGSVTAITNNTGSVVKTYRYDSFGNIVAQTGTLVNPYTYTGREYDSEAELYNYRNRYYNPVIGRFLQIDPYPGPLSEPQTLNLYPYVGNNPVNFIDPTGEMYIFHPNFWVEMGETQGEKSLQYFASRMDDSTLNGLQRGAAYAGVFFAAMWTPCTSWESATTLIGAVGVTKLLNWAAKTGPIIMWKGGEIVVKSGEKTIFRINPFGNPKSKNQLGKRPHYHRRPFNRPAGPGEGIGQRRPWGGGW